MPKKTTSAAASQTVCLHVLVMGLVGVSGCGFATVHKLQALGVEELAVKSDDFICDGGARIEMLSKLPPVWIRELKRRDLWECVSEYRRDGGATRVIIQKEKPQ